jgi:hypothetical protein
MNQKVCENYEVMPEITEDGFYKIKILSGEFSGCVYTFGKVEFPDENEPILSFDYNLIEGKVDDKKKFENTIGDILVQLLQKAIEQKELIFKGGTDEN